MSPAFWAPISVVAGGTVYGLLKWQCQLASPQSKFMEQQRAKWKEEKALLHQEIANKDLSMKHMQAELDSSQEKVWPIASPLPTLALSVPGLDSKGG